MPAYRRRRARATSTPICERFSRVTLRFGFMETPNVPKALAIARKLGLAIRHHVDVVLPLAPLAQASSAIPACRSGRIGCSSSWRVGANDATDYFQIPTGRVVEVGTQVAV